MIEGVVLTFTDISERIVIEKATQEARELAESIVDTVREPLLVLDDRLTVVSASRSFYQFFQVKPEETVGCQIYALGNRQWDIPALRELLQKLLISEQAFEGYLVEHDFPVIGQQKMVLNARRIDRRTGEVRLVLLAMEKVM